MGDFFILTVKEKVRSATSAIVNREEEFSMSPDSYARLKGKCDGNMVEKTRYRIPLSSSSPKLGEGDRSEGVVEEYVAELDIFHGRHEGLRLVEVEFPSVEAADAFVPPAWFGQDVSEDPRYRNSYLSHNS